MAVSKNKITTGISLDHDIYEVLKSNPYTNKSALMNDLIRQAMVARGMIEA
jgi:hypothetical protein